MADRKISLCEVKQHNKDDDVWIIINNDVYDVTAFLNEHPGGSEVIIEQAGKDASKPFEDVGHSSDAKKLMLKYKVGKIVSEEMPQSGPSIRYLCHFAVAAVVGLLLGVIIKRRLHSS